MKPRCSMRTNWETRKDVEQKLFRMVAMLLFRDLGDSEDFHKYIAKLDALFDYPVECEKWSAALVRFRIGSRIFDLNRTEVFKGKKLDYQKKEKTYI